MAGADGNGFAPDWNGFAPDGTERRRTGVLRPKKPPLRDVSELGESTAGPNPGLAGAAEYVVVVDAGVPKPPGELAA